MSATKNQPARAPTGPTARRAAAVLLVPAALLTLLIVAFVVSRGGTADEAQIRRALPLLIAIGHTTAAALLVVLLRREGRGLGSIGWRAGPAGSVAAELALGTAAALAFYLLKELVFDSIRALAAGSTPTFTTLFRFTLERAELPLLLVATTFAAVEESIYRGYGLPPLVARLGRAGGLVTMAALFALLHWGNGGFALLFTGTLGVLFGVLFLWRRSLIAPAVAHALYNALVIST